jgi:Ca-activated chloride channel family protein
MKYELDDPRLTAHALGELDDTEKADVEAFLNDNEAARDEVARIREAAQWLSAELGAEPPEGLSELERARIVDQAKKAKPARKIHWRRWAVAVMIPFVLSIGSLGYLWATTNAGMVSPFVYTLGEPTSFDKAVALRWKWHNTLADLWSAPSSKASGQGAGVSANAPKVEAHDLQLSYANGSATPVAAPAPVAHEGTVGISPEEIQSGALAAPAKAANWNSVGTKTMSQQAVIDLSEPAKQVSASAPPPPAPASPSASAATSAVAGASYGLQNVQAGGNVQVRTDFYGQDINGNGQESKDSLKSLGYVGANAPGVMEKKEDKAKRAEATQNVQAFIQLPPPPPTPVPNAESYPSLPENTFQRVADAPLSTFGLDVDTASYANVRRFLSQGTLPPGEAVRIEELINYFKYDYPKPEGDAPFSVTVDAHPCPWAPTHTLARIGVRGKELNTETRPSANLVFLIDVSGSMQDADKLPLLKKGMKLLTQTVTANDRVSIVTYASGTGVALYPTPGDNKAAIESIIDNLQAGGSTNGAGGIQLAYDLARRAFIQGGVNRVILATDGDFNVGVSDTNTLVGMIEQQAKTGVALSVLGFGQGNLKDERMMKLADKGNGNYNYIDSFNEARKVLLEQATGTLFTIAKDVKIQVEFNPARVGAYRLIGYEKRALAAQDFNDDRKDAGEIGAGHTVTALYELVPPGEAVNPPNTDPLKYQANPEPAPAPAAGADSPEMMTVKLRFKPPTGDVSTRFDVPVPATVVTAETRPDFQFASAVAAFGMLLRNSSHAGAANMDMVVNLAQQGKGGDAEGLRAEFINLAKTAAALMGTPKPGPGRE